MSAGAASWEYVIHVWCDDNNSPYRQHKGNASHIARFGYGPPDTPERILLELGAVTDIGPRSWQVLQPRPRNVAAAIDETVKVIERTSEEDFYSVLEASAEKLEAAWAASKPMQPNATRSLHFLDGSPGATPRDLEEGNAYVKYALRCPRCPLNATLRAERMAAILDEVRGSGRDLVSLAWLARESAGANPV